MFVALYEMAPKYVQGWCRENVTVETISLHMSGMVYPGACLLPLRWEHRLKVPACSSLFTDYWPL